MANYDSKPSILEAVGNGSFLYRFNIEENTSEIHAEGVDEPVSTRTSWDCNEVVVWSPLTSNKITRLSRTETRQRVQRREPRSRRRLKVERRGKTAYRRLQRVPRISSRSESTGGR